MGHLRTKTMRKAGWVIIKKHCIHLGNDFHTNKRTGKGTTIIPSEKPHNKTAGCVTHLMKQIQRGLVTSIKLQGEERERMNHYVPEFSALGQEMAEVDPDTKEMLKLLNLGSLSKP
ncbi:40S ribosomal protein S17-like [Acinonyx jubatus]|uniref:40S ribosomal protein S17-like n=1 Tax=Acinonyx jubatus TaxID=32536 RepID=A0A6J1ZNM1_ACIJB|nr:40S ribosomal protein S17-like [Acinonyx jubatus]